MTQPTFTCLKPTMEATEKWVKFVESKQRRDQNDFNGIALVYLLLTLNTFYALLLCAYC